jgi:hypothetical protein
LSFAKVPPEVLAAFEAALPVDARVERRKMFGCPCAFASGNLFFGCFEDRITVRLPPEARTEVLASLPGARPFAPLGGHEMREYLEIPGDTPARTLTELAARSFAWAVDLPRKVKKPAKKR